MANNKIVDLAEYRSKKQFEKHLAELERIKKDEYPLMSPTEQQGYRNFVKLIKAVDKTTPRKPDGI